MNGKYLYYIMLGVFILVGVVSLVVLVMFILEGREIKYIGAIASILAFSVINSYRMLKK